MKTRLCLLVALLLGAVPATAQRYVRSFPTIDALLASTPADVSTNAWVAGRNAPGDGGEGPLYYDKASTTVTNLGTIHKPNGANGRWKRPVPGAVFNAKWFGARGDGTTDDTAALNNMLSTFDPVSGRPGVYIVPAGRYRINSLLGFGGTLRGEGHIERGTDVVPKSATVFEHILGATGDGLTINTIGGAGGPSMTVERILWLGHPEYNLRDPMTITGIATTNRMVFQVATPPAIYGAKGSHPYLGFGALFTDENRYLGTFMLKEFTNYTGIGTTNWVQIATGTDTYATVNGEDLLRVGFKVTFPKSTTWYSNGSSLGLRSFSHMAGYSAIVAWDAADCIIRDCKFINWHTGIAIDSGSYVAEGIETYNCFLSGLIAEPFGFLADANAYGFMLLNGKYQLDDALVPNSYTLKNTVYRYAAIGFGALGAQAKIDNIVAGPSALYGAFLYGGTHSHINNLLVEAPASVPVFMPIGNSVSPQAATSISRLRVLGGYAADTIPDNRRNDLAIVEVNTSASALNIAQISVAPFTLSGNATNWTWAFWYKWPNTSTDTQLGIGEYHDPYQMVPRGSQKPGGAYNTQKWQMMGGVTVVGGAATEPIAVFQRDVAEPNANKFGLTYSGGAKFMFAHNGDGVVDDIGYTFESTTSATQLTLGNLSGSATPRTAIVQGEIATGTDVAGGSVQFRPGTSTGGASTASMSWYTPTVGTGGTSTAQTQTLRMTLGQGGHLAFAGQASDPAVGTLTGGIYYNNTSNVFRVHNGTAWKPVKTGVVIRIAANLNFPSTSAQTESDTTVSVPGAVLGDVVNLGVPNASVVAGSFFNAWVSATDTVTVRFNNYSSTSKDPALGTFTIDVEQ